MQAATTQRVDIMGSLLHWSISGQHNRDKLAAGFAYLGLEKFVPAEKTDRSALKSALKEVCCQTSDFMVQAREEADTNGLEVVKIERAQHGNAYFPTVAAKVIADGVVLVLEPGSFETHNLAAMLQAQFNVAKGEVSGSSIGKSLVAIAHHYGAVCTRPCGGVYYLPPQAKEKFAAVAKAVEASAEEDGKSRIDVFEFIYSASAMRAVRDALIAEVKTETEQMTEDFNANPNPKKDFIERRMERADQLRQKIEQYESILSEPLEGLRESLDAATVIQGASLLATMAG